MAENFREPQSANEALLQNILGAQNETREPQSVTEYYLQKILEQGGGGGGSAVLIVETTYADLVSAKEAGTLKEGAFYRITDYETIINGTYDFTLLVGAPTYLHYAKATGHQFDLIVQALDNETLSEHAKAIKHDGDTWFINEDLAAWDIRYTIDNSAYIWGDRNGKGIIYFMRDEYGNEAPYDFKNIQFLAYAITNGDEPVSGLNTFNYDENDNRYRYGTPYDLFEAASDYMQSGTYNSPFLHIGKDFSVGGIILGAMQYPEVNDEYLSTFNAGWYYTFHDNDSIFGDATRSGKCRNNKISVAYDPWVDNVTPFLNCNIINVTSSPSEQYYIDTCNNNIFGENCAFNIFGKISSVCFGAGCQRNIISRYCQNISIDNNCRENAIGYGNYNINFGLECISNKILDASIYAVSHDIEMGNGAEGNTIATSRDIFIGNSSINNSFVYCDFIHLEDSCQYNFIDENCHHIHLCMGCQQASFSSGHWFIIALTGNYSSTTISVVHNNGTMAYIGFDSNGNFKHWIPADLVT